jgi:CO/xanthine dehydrogenase Mo-binding subunit
VRSIGELIYTNTVPTSPFRGFGLPQFVFGIETHIDHVAKELDIDPIELRLKNVSISGDVTVHGRQLNSCGLKECMMYVRENSCWEKHKNYGSITNDRFQYGIGIANAVHVSGNRQAFRGFEGTTVYIKLEEDGRLQLISGEQDAGQGSETIFCQIAADTLGVSMDQIKILTHNSEYLPFGLGTFANRGTMMSGNAIIFACRDLKEKMIRAVAKYLKINEEKVSLQNWEFTFNDGRESIAVTDIARELLYMLHGNYIIGVGEYDPGTDVDQETLYGNLSAAYPFMSQAIRVKVDTWTGKVTVLDVCSAYDIGTVLNVKAAIGQANGGTIQGIGWALTENVVISDKGRMLNPNFTDYKIPTFMELPSMKNYFIQIFDPNGPYGSKAIGQLSICSAAAAIVNAIFDATGVLYDEVPVKPERLLLMIREKTRKDNISDLL